VPFIIYKIITFMYTTMLTFLKHASCIESPSCLGSVN
jgi:hypothetical protein